MPISECDNCGGQYHWTWEEAFDKFGFQDGDGQIQTWQVEDVLVSAGYEVEVMAWGMHNTIIQSIKKGEKEFLPHHNSEFQLGYDDPRDYLPRKILHLLDKELPVS